MKIVTFLLITVVLISAAPATEKKLMRITVETQNPQELRNQLIRKGFDTLHPSSTGLDVIVSHQELNKIKALGLKVISLKRGRPFKEIAGIQDQSLDEPALGVSSLPIGYLDYQGIIDQMTGFADTYPNIARVVDLTTVFNVPETYQGRHIYAMKISGNIGAEPSISKEICFILATAHAREVVNPVIALYAIQQLTQAYSTDARITAAVDNHEIWILPVLNPDGYEYVFNIDNMWRKNRRVLDGGIGVDVNRNFPFGWYDSCSGSTSVDSLVYKGPSPLSEAESQTMASVYETLRFGKYIDFHSYGSEVVVSYAQCAQHPWTDWLQTEAHLFSRNLSYNTIRGPSASGELYQWFLSRGAYSFLVETGRQFQPTYDSALVEAQQVWQGILPFIERATPLSGRITSTINGAPVVNAIIRFPDVDFANDELFTSGPSGRYHCYLPGGTYTIKVTAGGYTPFEQMITVTDGTATILDIQMNISPDSGILGNTDVFSNTSTSQNRRAEPFSMPQNGTVSSISMYHIGGSGNMRLAVYDGTGSPRNRLATTPLTAVSGSTGWQTIELTTPVHVEAGTVIWLAWVYESNPGIKYKSETPQQAGAWQTLKGVMPDPFGRSIPSDDIYSIYANFKKD